MNYIHNDDDFATEPKRGLPALLPRGEFVLWQGAPDWRTFARQTYRTPALALGILAVAGIQASVSLNAGEQLVVAAGQAAIIISFGLVGLGILYGLSWLVQKTTVYTITNRRVMMRVGVAIQKTFNVPFAQVDGAALKPHGRKGHGSISLLLKPGVSIAYLLIWPHARPWRMGKTEPTLRGIADAKHVGKILGDAFAALVDEHSATAATKAALANAMDGSTATSNGDSAKKEPKPLREERPYIGRKPVFVAFGIAAFALVFVAADALQKRGTASEPPTEPSYTLAITFEAQPDQSVAVLDANTGQAITQLPPQGEGLLRGALRGFGRTRTSSGLATDAPYELRRIPEDGLYLVDPTTGADVRLDSFGPTQSGALADLLALGR